MFNNAGPPQNSKLLPLHRLLQLPLLATIADVGKVVPQKHWFPSSTPAYGMLVGWLAQYATQLSTVMPVLLVYEAPVRRRALIASS
jgi:hypothetical protein